MRAIIGADYHIGSSRLDIGKKLLQATTRLALKEHCSHVIIAGDLLDEKTGVRVEVLQALWDEFETSRKKGVVWVWLRGNHEIGVKSQPHRTIMNLFSPVCHPIVEPAVWELENATLLFLPWYLPQEFIENSQNFSRIARQYTSRLKILISHIGLDEGKASPSNMYVQQAVSWKHLCEEAYDLILLGDYHCRQALTQKTHYLGCPISHVYGDDNNNGVWLLDTTLNLFQPIQFDCTFPAHKTWDIQDPQQSCLYGYDPQDHNRIVISKDWYQTYKDLYHDAQINIRAEAPDNTARRLKCLVNPNSPEEIWAQYCTLKEQSRDVQALGYKILGEVAQRAQASAK